MTGAYVILAFWFGVFGGGPVLAWVYYWLKLPMWGLRFVPQGKLDSLYGTIRKIRDISRQKDQMYVELLQANKVLRAENIRLLQELSYKEVNQ